MRKRIAPMEMLQNDKVILRDLLPEDIPSRIRWETVETEWQNWDAPWEYEGLTDVQRQASMQVYLHSLHDRIAKIAALPPDAPRSQLQIVVNDGSQKYIGWCSSYRIDAQYCYHPNGSLCAIGIDIPAMDARRKGYGYAALSLFIDYLRRCGESTLYLQTWSGNLRMLGLAHKLGFREVDRKVGIRTIRGQSYDALTLRLL